MTSRSPRVRRAPPQVRGPALVARVLDATVEELALTGYEGLTLERVAARAGVNRTTIFRRWPTKTALVRASVEHTRAEVRFDWDTGSLRGDLAVLLERAQRSLFAPGMLGLQRLGPPGADEPALHAEARRAQKAKHVAAFAMLRRAEARGELRADLDRALFLDTLLGLLISRVVFQREPVTPAFVRQVLDYLEAVARPGPPATPARPPRRRRS